MFNIETLINPPPAWTSYNYVFKDMRHSISMDPGILVQDADFNESKLKREKRLRHYRGYAVEDTNFFFVWEDRRQGWELIQKEDTILKSNKANIVCGIDVNASRPFHKIIPDIITRNRIKARAQILYFVLNTGLKNKNLYSVNFIHHIAQKDVNSIYKNYQLTFFIGQKVIIPHSLLFRNPFHEKNMTSSHNIFKYLELLETLSSYNAKHWTVNSSEIKLNIF